MSDRLPRRAPLTGQGQYEVVVHSHGGRQHVHSHRVVNASLDRHGLTITTESAKAEKFIVATVWTER